MEENTDKEQCVGDVIGLYSRSEIQAFVNFCGKSVQDVCRLENINLQNIQIVYMIFGVRGDIRELKDVAFVEGGHQVRIEKDEQQNFIVADTRVYLHTVPSIGDVVKTPDSERAYKALFDRVNEYDIIFQGEICPIAVSFEDGVLSNIPSLREVFESEVLSLSPMKSMIVQKDSNGFVIALAQVNTETGRYLLIRRFLDDSEVLVYNSLGGDRAEYYTRLLPNLRIELGYLTVILKQIH